MKKIPKNGVKGTAQFGNYWVASSFPDYKLSCRIFSESRAKELLECEKEIQSMRKVAIENYKGLK